MPALNRADLLQRIRALRQRTGGPRDPGLEFAGVVAPGARVREWSR
ncbi:MAG: hypothetical protein R2705_17300 [Ilumatobacteraceae bacterium]